MFTLTNQHHIKEGSLSKMKTGSNASLPVWYSFIHSQVPTVQMWVLSVKWTAAIDIQNLAGNRFCSVVPVLLDVCNLFNGRYETFHSREVIWQKFAFLSFQVSFYFNSIAFFIALRCQAAYYFCSEQWSDGELLPVVCL